MISPCPIDGRRAALVIAHPGHELRVHGWLRKHRPVVFVLTDGSGQRNVSRLASTGKLLQAAGADEGSIFGRLADRRLYERVVRSDVRWFQSLACELAASLVQRRIEVVVGDAEEGAMMAHDLWRGVRIAAVRMAEEQLGYPIRHYDFLVDGAPRDAARADGGSLSHRLDRMEFDDKLLAARGYRQVAPFVEDALNRYGADAFAEEVFYEVDSAEPFRETGTTDPDYERHGRQVVEGGVYSEIIRFDRHLAPVFSALNLFTPAMS